MNSDLLVPDCNPGQQPSLRRLLGWLEARASARQNEMRRLRRASAAQEAAEVRGALHSPSEWIERARQDGLRVLGPNDVDWRMGDGSATNPDDPGGDTLLGHAALWTCLSDAVLWCDLAVIGWFAGGAQVLPMQTAPCVDGGQARLALTVANSDCTSLAAAGVSLARMRRALGSADESLWLLRLEGAGAFVSIGLDLSIEATSD